MSQRTVIDIARSKGREKLAALTAYDFQTASMLDEAGVDLLLVGDSLANVIYGFPSTLPATMEMMLAHTHAVSRAAKRSLVVADMPFGSYQPSTERAIENASRFLAEGGDQAVKLEGGKIMAETVARLVELGIPVMGHIGLTPQSIHQLGGYKMQGKNASAAERIHQDALALEQAGVFSLVLECVETSVAAQITKALTIPTIGIGSGPDCDGQILVTNDLLGYSVSHIPKFVKPLVNLRALVTENAMTYVKNVKSGSS